MNPDYGYRIASGSQLGANLNSTTAVVAAVTGRVLSLKHLVVSNSSTAAQTVTIESSGGADMLILYLAISQTVTLDFHPGQLNTVSGEALNALASTTNVLTVYAEAYVMNTTI